MNLRPTLLSVLLCPLALFAQEVCNNGIDDDGDGLVDLNDPDCPCSTLLAPPDLPSYIRNHSFEERGCCPFGFVSGGSPPWLDCATGWHQATGSTSDYLNMCGYAPAGMPMPPPDGEGAIGFYCMTEYKEYVGTCLTYPLPANPLIAGTTYTLSLWVAAAATDDVHAQTAEQGQAIGMLYPDQLPLAIFGYANGCVPFPVDVPSGVNDCIGGVPGWQELGRTYVQPSWGWVRVSMTFTPTQDIHSIMIGAACDLPASFVSRTYMDSQGQTADLLPYFLADDLLLTEAQDQVLSPTSVTGNLCAENVMATALPPVAASGFQWYLNGVALPGETSTTLDVSGGDHGPGIYTMASTFNGECLMGSAPVAPAAQPKPFPSVLPAVGCSPLSVQFADTSGGGIQTVLWDLGDGSTRTDSSFTHTYTVPGSYDIALTVMNSAGCTGDTLIPQAITVHPGVSGTITATPDPVNAEEPSVQLNGSGSGDILSWWWDLGSADPATSGSQTLNAIFPSTPGDYPVMLVVTSANGCTDTVRSMVTVIDPGVIEMPNVFSPNGDGSNDRFMPIGYKGAPGQLDIYNRWGQVVFSTRSLAQGWSGREAADGTYFYIVTPDEPGVEKLTGHITLVR